MFKNLLKLFFIILLLIENSYSQNIKSTPVGPGIIHHHESRETGPWQIHILEIDLSNEWIQLETVKAKNQLYGLEKTSSMAARNSKEGHKVIGAINGDFYKAGGIPVGAQILNGTLLKRPFSRSVFVVTNQNKPMINIVNFDGVLLTSNKKQFKINGVNESRKTDDLILFNKYFGDSTKTNYWGSEIVANNMSSQTVNDTVHLVVIKKDSIESAGHGNNKISNNGIVFSGHGLAKGFLDKNIFVSDTISIVLQLPPSKQQITQLLGGTPRLIRDGVPTVEWLLEKVSQGFTFDRHPRTALGFSQDSTKLYLFTVDGRQVGFSAGMSLFELAKYMLEWKVYQGINLDGGGSTTMVVGGNVVNRPSDASGERSVGNALMVVSTAPTGVLSSLKLAQRKVFVLPDGVMQFSVSGFDQYLSSVDVNKNSLIWSCDSSIGTIGKNGMFTAANQQKSGFVYVKQGNLIDSVKVNVTLIASITLTPNPIVLQLGQQQTISAIAKDSFGNNLDLISSDLLWSVSGEIGTISKTGVFTAATVGEGLVTAKYNSVVCSASVSVGASSTVIIDDFKSNSSWSLTGSNVNLAESSFSEDYSIHLSPPSSGKLTYSLTTGGISVLYLNRSIPISGSPDSVGIAIYGDGKKHWLRGEFEDRDGEKFLVNFIVVEPGINWNKSWKYLGVSLKNAETHWNNPTATLTFPITWKKIYLVEADDANKNSGMLHLDNFSAQYIK